MKGNKKIIQKIILIILAVSLLLPVKVPVSGADEILVSGDFQYKIVGDDWGAKTAIIYGYTGEDSDLFIPETIDGYKVTGVSSLDGCRLFLDSVVLPKYVEWITSYMTQTDCNGEEIFVEIKKYEVVKDNPYLSARDGVLFNKKQTKLLTYPYGKTDAEYVEPVTVEKHNQWDIHNPYVKKWTISSNKKCVETAYAYDGLTNLEEVTIPKNIIVISDQSFANCKKLKKINWHNGLERIYAYAFMGCSSLTGVKIPDNVLSIGGSAFKNCNLSTVKLPDKLSYIGPMAFAGNPNLKRVKIPDSVTKMSKEAFDIRQTKLMKPSYLKTLYYYNNYLAKATVTSKGKTKDYRAIYITKIKAEKKRVTVKKGSTKKLRTKVYINNTVKKKKQTGILKTNILQFSSSNKKVVKIYSNGKIKALKKGTAVITVTLRTAKESYQSKKIFNDEGEIIRGSVKTTRKSYKVKVKVE